MATTQTKKGLQVMWPFHVDVVDLTTIDPAASIDVAHGGPSGANALWVTQEVIVNSTSKDPVFITHAVASDSTTNNTVRIVADTVGGGDLTGMTCRLYIWFVEAASGGNRNSA